MQLGNEVEVEAEQEMQQEIQQEVQQEINMELVDKTLYPIEYQTGTLRAQRHRSITIYQLILKFLIPIY